MRFPQAVVLSFLALTSVSIANPLAWANPDAYPDAYADALAEAEAYSTGNYELLSERDAFAEAEAKKRLNRRDAEAYHGYWAAELEARDAYPDAFASAEPSPGRRGGWGGRKGRGGAPGGGRGGMMKAMMGGIGRGGHPGGGGKHGGRPPLGGPPPDGGGDAPPAGGDASAPDAPSKRDAYPYAFAGRGARSGGRRGSVKDMLGGTGRAGHRGDGGKHGGRPPSGGGDASPAGGDAPAKRDAHPYAFASPGGRGEVGIGKLGNGSRPPPPCWLRKREAEAEAFAEPLAEAVAEADALNEYYEVLARDAEPEEYEIFERDAEPKDTSFPKEMLSQAAVV